MLALTLRRTDTAHYVIQYSPNLPASFCCCPHLPREETRLEELNCSDRETVGKQ